MTRMVLRGFWGFFFGTALVYVLSSFPYMAFLALPGVFGASLIVAPDADSARMTFETIFNGTFYALIFMALGSIFGRQRAV